VRKLLVLAGLAALGAWAYRTINDSRAADAVWTDATAFPPASGPAADLR
jgi:hypothetical protein